MDRRSLLPFAIVALAACQDVTQPARIRPAGPEFLVVPLWPDTVGICLGAGSPSGTYTFNWMIQNGQPDDIHDVTSPTAANLGPGACLAPWRRLTRLAADVRVTVIVTEMATPSGVALDSVQVQDRSGDHVSLSATDTAQVDTISGSGGAFTFYHERLRRVIPLPVLVAILPLPRPDPSLAFGRVRVSLDAQHPPNPCGPMRALRGGSAVALCGEIRNPGAETFTGGVLTAGGLSIPFATIAFPPDPCRQYVVQGTFAVPAGLATQLAADPSGLVLRFNSVEHPDGAIGGSPSASRATPSEGGAVAGSRGASAVRGSCLVRFGS
jgi:hypothetical protein